MDFERDRHGGPDPQGAAATLLLGPGRPHELQRLMRGQNPSRVVKCLTDLAELLYEGSGVAILDGNLLPTEDLGILRRALKAGKFEVTVLGGDPSAGALRQFLKHPRARWVPYPPDSDELSLMTGRSLPQKAALKKAPVKKAAPETAPTRPETPAQAPDVKPPEDPHLAEIEAILSQPVSALQATDSVDKKTELQPEPSPELEVEAPEQTNSSPETPEESYPQQTPPASTDGGPRHSEAPWFKDQVADLADIVQTIYAATSAIEGEGQGSAPPGLYSDAMRLVQFTRTLGYLAAPPARGDNEFDLTELSEELLRAAGASADAPRFLLRTSEPLTVRANKELVVQAMDAILVLARLCAGPEGEVRLSGQREGGRIVLNLGFPSGPLGGLSPEEIVVPYALRGTLPDMGKNALRAASRIMEGQGGSLVLNDQGGGQLRFTVSLPAI